MPRRAPAAALLSAAGAAAAATWRPDAAWPAAPAAAYIDATARHRPTGVAYDPAGKGTHYVYRGHNSSAFAPLTTFDADGNVVARWGEELVQYAHDVQMYAGSLWVTDMGDYTIKEVDPVSRRTLRTLGTAGEIGHGVRPLQFSNVSSFLLAPDGSAFVTDGDSLGSCNPLANARVVKLRRGSMEVEWVVGNNATRGPGDSVRFEDPHSLDWDARHGWVWVADRGNNRTVALDPATGALVASVDLNPTGYTVNGVKVDSRRGWLILGCIPKGTHQCLHPPAASSVEVDVGEGASALLVMDISDPHAPKTVFGPEPTTYPGNHALSYDQVTGDVYISFLAGNAVQRLLMSE